ncbi:uncharacterized protein LOC132054605 [Lycium ferocissimum]|uniref:uncharacterized protein LOC132054605 n=1 Tax=Lycium ferocissimum TaxID=112874 RepID=UPI00281605F2|nr:uncharacterized protein LOC132054605 [Lycium ferocissimum]
MRLIDKHTLNKRKRPRMLSLSFNSFMLVVVFILLSVKDTVAHTTHDQVEQKFGVNEAGNRIAKSGEKELVSYGHVPASIEVIAASGRIGGRKRLESIMTKEDSKNSVASATFSVGNFNHKGKGKLRMQSKLSTTGRSVQVNRGSLLAFSADYHMPKTHPPQNN